MSNGSEWFPFQYGMKVYSQVSFAHRDAMPDTCLFSQRGDLSENLVKITPQDCKNSTPLSVNMSRSKSSLCTAAPSPPFSDFFLKGGAAVPRLLKKRPHVWQKRVTENIMMSSLTTKVTDRLVYEHNVYHKNFLVMFWRVLKRALLN